jgi:hypothetical protein
MICYFERELFLLLLYVSTMTSGTNDEISKDRENTQEQPSLQISSSLSFL